MKSVFSLITCLCFFALLSSCEKENIQPAAEAADLQIDEAKTALQQQRRGRGTLNRIYFSTDVMTLSHAEYERVIDRMQNIGFTVGSNCNYIGSQTASSQAAWENRIASSLDVLFLGNDNITFRFDNLLFTSYECVQGAPLPSDPYCTYYQSDATLTVFSGQGTYGCYLNTFTLDNQNQHVTINIAPLARPYGASCNAIC